MLGVRPASEIKTRISQSPKRRKCGELLLRYSKVIAAPVIKKVYWIAKVLLSLFSHHVDYTGTVSLGPAAYLCLASSPAKSITIDQFAANSTIRLMASGLNSECLSR